MIKAICGIFTAGQVSFLSKVINAIKPKIAASHSG